jgi:hypothetical protein
MDTYVIYLGTEAVSTSFTILAESSKEAVEGAIGHMKSLYGVTIDQLETIAYEKI